MKQTVFFTIFVAYSILFAVGCRRERLNADSGTFTMKGRLMEGCPGTPAKGIPLSVYFRTAKLTNNTMSFDIGKDTTDSLGYFSIVCQNKGRGDYSIVGDGKDWLHERRITPSQNMIDELGDLRYTGTYYAAVRIRASATRNSSDTLYLGMTIAGTRQIILSPGGTWTEQFEKAESSYGPQGGDGRLPDEIESSVHWAIGANVYYATEGPLMQQQKREWVPFQLCQAKDTFEVFIP